MSSNLNIIQDWIDGKNFRPTSINFSDLSEEKQAERDSKIGDRWVDADGKTWQKTKYGKRSIPKVITALEETNPNCKACGKQIHFSNRHDVTSYGQTKLCFDCMVELDTKRKLNGNFKEYEQLFVFKKQKDYVTETLDQLRDGLKYLDSEDDKLEFVNEFGDREVWSGLNVEKLKTEISEEIKEGEKALSRIDKQIKKLETLNLNV